MPVCMFTEEEREKANQLRSTMHGRIKARVRVTRGKLRKLTLCIIGLHALLHSQAQRDTGEQLQIAARTYGCVCVCVVARACTGFISLQSQANRRKRARTGRSTHGSDTHIHNHSAQTQTQTQTQTHTHTQAHTCAHHRRHGAVRRHRSISAPRRIPARPPPPHAAKEWGSTSRSLYYARTPMRKDTRSE